jgi:GDP-4-dehydro-6-deoxy-D-mannose reductase
MVRALCLAAERCQHGEVYNAGATQTYSVEDLIEVIRARVKVPFQIQQDEGLMRGCDEPVIAGDINKFQQCTGWRPEIELAETLNDMLDWWRHQLCAPPNCSCVARAESISTGISELGRLSPENRDAECLDHDKS